ncbi:MAG: hypothetical protein MJ016_01130 [Victivallaceae bacterium]|nr:hypothetical protein [Victivallaceae bacterium]
MKKAVFISIAVIALAALVFCYFRKPSVFPVKLSPLATTTLNDSALSEIVTQITADYQSDCKRLLQQFDADLKRAVAPHFDQARNAVPETVGELSKFKACAKMCYKAAKDQLTGSNDFAPAFIEAIDEPIVQPGLRANAVADEMLKTLQLRLQERSMQYAADLASTCEMEKTQGASRNVAALEKCVTAIAQTTQELQRKTIIATLSVAMEAVFIRSTCSAVCALIAKPAAKIATTAGVSVTCAAADGPIPVGDAVSVVVTVAGLGWTIYDVYDVCRVMPEKLRTQMYQSLDEAKNALIAEAGGAAKKMTETHMTKAQKLNATLIKQLQ